MKHLHLSFCVTLFALCAWPAITFAQTPKPTPALTLTRTTTRREVRKLGFGTTVTLLGGPWGNITVEGWNKNEIEIVADIEVKAANEEDLNRLAAIDNFILDEGFTTLNIITTGAHDKDFIKRYAKGFPKKLIGTPWRIDYKLKVPHLTDLELNGGYGAVTLRGVEGALALKMLEGDADLTLTGGAVVATIGHGTVNVNLAGRSWRGRGAAIQVALGNLNVIFPPAYNADIDARVLRTGAIENAYPALTLRERAASTPNSLQSRTGNGGAMLAFTVGDGTLRLQTAKTP